VLLDAGEMGTRLQSRLKDNTKVQGETVCSVDKDLEDDCGKAEVKVNLPKLQFPIFDGKMLEWQKFWDTFSCINKVCQLHQNVPT